MKQYFLSNKTELINVLNKVKEGRPAAGVRPVESRWLTAEWLRGPGNGFHSPPLGSGTFALVRTVSACVPVIWPW